MTPDLFGGPGAAAAPSGPQPAAPAAVPLVTPRGAIARAVAHMEALTYARRAAEGSPDGAWWPADDWLRNFAISPLGRDQAARLQKALRRLSPEERHAVAEFLRQEDAHGR